MGVPVPRPTPYRVRKVIRILAASQLVSIVCQDSRQGVHLVDRLPRPDKVLFEDDLHGFVLLDPRNCESGVDPAGHIARPAIPKKQRSRRCCSKGFPYIPRLRFRFHLSWMRINSGRDMCHLSRFSVESLESH